MNRKSNEITHELVLNEYDKLTLIAQEETKKAVKYLAELSGKKRKKDKQNVNTDK